MELKVLKDDPFELEFVLKENRHTFPNLLRSRLLHDASVSFVACKLLHPLDEECHFIVKTKGKKAKKALLEASEKIDEDLHALQKTIEKKLK
ncbi:hypothetical protein KKE06_00710 [Candidatus Micrarchaeota archaeon]|nr:hypothetical protein [Candidatus Micrarchaeota archaeon]MBU1930127.1 hypothetical protein [Candidatus Micrarchaeota archaeon]